MKILATVVCVVGMLAGSASAQDAVQWRVEDGGNGHWYRGIASPMTRSQATSLAAEQGGHLATITAAAENQFLADLNLPSQGGAVSYWTGGIRASAGAGPWNWITGEAWNYSNFDTSEPNGCCGADVRFTTFRTYEGHEGRWDDTSPENVQFVLIEWSADCNNDGIVDYGQILSGRLPDVNSNGVPDPCESDCDGNGLTDSSEIASGRAFDLDANQIPDACDSEDAAPVIRSIVVQRGPTCGWWTTASLSQIWDLWVSRASPTGPWLNGESAAGASILLNAQLTPGVNTLYLRHDSNGCDSTVWGLGLWFADTLAPDIAVKPTTPCEGYTNLMNSPQDGAVTAGSGRIEAMVGSWRVEVVSYSLSESGDLVQPVALGRSGSVDLLGVLELFVTPPCSGDITGGGEVNGIDLAAVLGAWGTDGQGKFDCDVDNDGIVNGADLATVLSAWGPCPN